MTTEEKEIYAIGEIPPLGFVPKKMHAWVIRRDRHGNPMQSFQEEEFDVLYKPKIDNEELNSIIGEIDGWIIRSGTKINKKHLEYSKKLNLV